MRKAYNDWVHELFSPEPERYVAAAFVPVDDVALAVAEAERCIAKGFRTLMLPCSYPWRPYDRPDYTPLWSLIEAAGVVLNFHVFTGNVFFGTDFASVDGMSVEEFAMRRESARVVEERMERLSTTVIGMAAGMGPIVHLTGGGVLERHPRLKFVVTEAEAGWLAWTLHAMDAMQHRRRLGLNTLSMRASDYFRRQGAVTITDDPIALNNLGITGTDCIMWGNDYPHDEGTYPVEPAAPRRHRCGDHARASARDLRRQRGAHLRLRSRCDRREDRFDRGLGFVPDCASHGWSWRRGRVRRDVTHEPIHPESRRRLSSHGATRRRIANTATSCNAAPAGPVTLPLGATVRVRCGVPSLTWSPPRRHRRLAPHPDSRAGCIEIYESRY